MTVTRLIDINIDDITPAELAKEFCDMNCDEQALFFHNIFVETEKWKKHFCFKLQGIMDSESMTDAGRRIMYQIGEYSGLFHKQITAEKGR